MKCVLRCESGNFLRKLTQSVTVGSLSTLALMAFALPTLFPSFDGAKIVWRQPAIAQTASSFTAEEIRNYARAVLSIEPRRQAVYEEIISRLGTAIPVVVCNQRRSINQLQPEVRAIAINYCTQAKATIESNDLTISQFNEITQQQQSNTQLKQQIQSELLRLEQSKGN